MAHTTLEEAKICPKCELPGEDRSQTPVVAKGLAPGTTAHMIYCVNERCTWYNTNWVVQVNPDGTIPPPQDHRAGRNKTYPNVVPPDMEKRIVNNLQRQLDAEQTDNAEYGRY